jgi:hypothetical protein
MNAHTFPANAPLWLAIWPNGDAHTYSRFADLAEDVAAGFRIEPVEYRVMLEDGRWCSADDEVAEAVEELEREQEMEARHAMSLRSMMDERVF